MQYLQNLLLKIGVLNDDQRVSITNVAVMVFIAICAFKSLFVGLQINTQYFTWKVEALDLNTNLPLLFSFLNYSHKRSELNKNESEIKT